MANTIIALTICGDEQQAFLIARALVEERLAACVNVLPQIHSIYRWKGAAESAQEVLLLAKTSGDVFPALRDRIVELHSYEVPEVIAVPVVAGLEAYLSWVGEQVVQAK